MPDVTWVGGQTLTASLTIAGAWSAADTIAVVPTPATFAGLPVIKGDQFLTKPGQRIQNAIVTGRVVCQADGTGSDNVWSQGSGSYPSNDFGLFDATNPAATNVTFNGCLALPTVSSQWMTGFLGNYAGSRLNSYNCCDSFGIYNTHGPLAISLTDCYAHDAGYFSPDTEHSDNRSHTDGCQCQGGLKGSATSSVILRRVVLHDNTSTQVGNGYPGATPAPPATNPYFPSNTAAAFSVTPAVGPVWGLDFEDVDLDYGAEGFIAILGNFPAPAQPLGSFVRVTVGDNVATIKGVQRKVVIDPAYTFTGGFQNRDGSPIDVVRNASIVRERAAAHTR